MILHEAPPIAWFFPALVLVGWAVYLIAHHDQHWSFFGSDSF